MSAATTPLAKRRPVIRVVLVLVTLVTAFHVFAQFLWIAPASALRELVPGHLLYSWQIPWFGQSWSVFAPDPINGNYHLKVRALVKDASGEHTTQWIDATDAEYELEYHKLLQPRAAALASEQASDYKSAWDDLTERQQEIVSWGYWKGDVPKGRFEKALRNAAGDDEDARKAAGRFMSKHAFTLAYATQAARAVWGDDVVRVQFEVYRQNAIPFAERNDPAAQEPPKQYAPTGWRKPFVIAGQSQEAFTKVFRPLVQDQLHDEDRGPAEQTTPAPEAPQTAPPAEPAAPAEPATPAAPADAATPEPASAATPAAPAPTKEQR